MDAFISITALQVKIFSGCSKCPQRHPELVVTRKELVVARTSQQKATSTTFCNKKRKCHPENGLQVKEEEQRSRTNNPRYLISPTADRTVTNRTEDKKARRQKSEGGSVIIATLQRMEKNLEEGRRQNRKVSTQLEKIISETFEKRKYVPKGEDRSPRENVQ